MRRSLLLATGTPACANTFLSAHTARGKWGLEGFIESDCDAVGDIYTALATHCRQLVQLAHFEWF